jgi:hypothetical protein
MGSYLKRGFRPLWQADVDFYKIDDDEYQMDFSV